MNKIDWHFKGKKVTVMGLGLLGRGIADAAFLAKHGADVTVTDIKTAEELAPSLAKLKSYPGIRYVLGGHREEDFEQADFILKGAGVPLDSPYVAHAREHGVPVEMDASLFAQLAEDVTLVGVTGTRGKSTTTMLLHEILKQAGKRVHLGGNVRGIATLPLLEKIRPGDIVVLELDSWQLQGFRDAGISPQVAVFTTFVPDHLNYYKGDMEKYFNDKAAIYANQGEDGVVIVGEGTAPMVTAKGRKIVARAGDIPPSWKVALPGAYNRLNVACALAAARTLGIQDAVSKKAIASFAALPGRLEFLRSVNGVAYYNDTNATTPDATVAALQTLSSLAKGRIHLIMGGAHKNVDMEPLISVIERYTDSVILLPGTGTDLIREDLARKNLGLAEAATMKEAVTEAVRRAEKGDIVVLSPGLASFGLFVNEYDRGDQFTKLIAKLA